MCSQYYHNTLFTCIYVTVVVPEFQYERGMKCTHKPICSYRLQSSGIGCFVVWRKLDFVRGYCSHHHQGFRNLRRMLSSWNWRQKFPKCQSQFLSWHDIISLKTWLLNAAVRVSNFATFCCSQSVLFRCTIFPSP